MNDREVVVAEVGTLEFMDFAAKQVLALMRKNDTRKGKNADYKKESDKSNHLRQTAQA